MPLLPGGRALTLERRTAWLPGVLSGRFVGDAQTITTFSIESFFRFFHAAPSPQPQPQPVVVGPYMSIFELFYYLITSYHYLATVYDSLPPPPYAARVMPLRAHPLAAVCAAAPGGHSWARGKAN